MLKVHIQMGQLLAHRVEQDVKLVPHHQLVQTVKFYMNSTPQQITVLLVQMENILQAHLGMLVPHVSPIVKHVQLPVPVQNAILAMDLVQEAVAPVLQVSFQMVRMSALLAD